MGPKENRHRLKLKMTSMEDDLSLKMDFLSNHWLDLFQILNLSSRDKTKIDEGFK
jgi:hypothetical protein